MAVQLPSDLMVSVSGVRGRVGPALTPELVAALASRFGTFAGREWEVDTIYVGRDSRTSGPMLVRAAIAGLQSVGSRVVDLGVVPTPTLMLAVEDAGGAAGIGVTASHNPAEWNALKFAGPDGMFLDAERTAAFHRLLEGDPPRAAWDRLGPVEEDRGAVARHVDRILALQHLDVEGLREREFLVAVDCVHGAGGVILPRLLEALGCRTAMIGDEVDGRFPRDPEPTPEHLEELSGLVADSGADLGVAVDPDGDRLALVDERGRPAGEDLTLALAAASVLRGEPGTAVTNLSTSQVVEDVVHERGGTLLRAPVGEIHVARAMEEADAVVGGEGNGGVILPALHHTRDAPVAVALVLQHLLEEEEPLSTLIGRWPSYEIVKDKMPFPREALEDAYRALDEDLGAPERDTTDGLRLSWPEERIWLHVRPSGTEPVVRLISEAPDGDRARALVGRAAELLGGVA